MATDLPVEQYAGVSIEVAYQEQETISADKPIEQVSAFTEAGYQEYEVKEKDLPIIEEPTVTDTTPSGGLIWIKSVINIVRFPFKGLAWLFDGSKFTEFPAQETSVVFPVVVTDGYLVMSCGMKEDGTLAGDVLGFGRTREIIENNTGRDLLALVSCEKDQAVYLVDNIGNVIKRVLPSEAVLLANGWKLVSDRSFKAFVRKV